MQWRKMGRSRPGEAHVHMQTKRAVAPNNEPAVPPLKGLAMQWRKVGGRALARRMCTCKPSGRSRLTTNALLDVHRLC